MGGSIWLPLLVFLFLLACSAFFSGAETAVMASRRFRLTSLADRGDRGAKIALGLISHPGKFLATMLVGNNIVNVLAATIGTTLLGPVYASIVVTLLLLVFGEVTPKTLAAYQPEEVTVKLAPVLQRVQSFLRPVVWLTNGLANLMLIPFLGGERVRERRYSRQDLLTAISMGAREGTLEPSETRITQEIFKLKDLPVHRIMIPLEEVEGVAVSSTYEEVMQEVARTGNTRYPVYRSQLFEMLGLLLVKDLLVHPEGSRENWRQYVRPLMRVQGELEVDELLRDMQIQRYHMAAVENREENVVGIVTMEDVLEEIVGEIQDEHDEDEGELIREVRPGRYAVLGRVEVDDLCKMINIDLGLTDQHMTLAQWFEKQCERACTRSRRLKMGNIRVIQRGGGRFEILTKGEYNLEDPARVP